MCLNEFGQFISLNDDGVKLRRIRTENFMNAGRLTDGGNLFKSLLWVDGTEVVVVGNCPIIPIVRFSKHGDVDFSVSKVKISCRFERRNVGSCIHRFMVKFSFSCSSCVFCTTVSVSQGAFCRYFGYDTLYETW